MAQLPHLRSVTEISDRPSFFVLFSSDPEDRDLAI